MRHKITIFTTICFLISAMVFGETNMILSNGHLKGKITDKVSGEMLPGVSIYFPELKTGTLSKNDGSYSIDKLPSTKLLLQVTYIGYKMESAVIDLTTTETLDFEIEESATEISEVVVTGQSLGVSINRTPSPISVVPRAQLLQNSASNIIDALSSVPGISQVTTGAGISKPIIRGLGYNRVVVLVDGIRQEGQQWGDEHGIELDENRVDHVEILKGPASLAYGSDAMAGVINMLSAPTLAEGSIQGNVSSNFQTNNGLINNSVNLAGNKKGLIWDVRFSNKLAHAYQNKYDSWVYNSGFRENSANATIGLNRSWGFSHLNMSWYYLEPGIIEGDRDFASGNFLKTTFGANGSENQEVATMSDFKSYQPGVPFQKIDHYKAVWNNSVFVGQTKLDAIVGFQQNQRKEFIAPNQYGLFFLLNTLNYDLKLSLPEVKNFKIASGVNGMWQQSRNKGTEYLVSSYDLYDVGVFAMASKKAGDFDFSGGIRYDRRLDVVDDLFLTIDNEVVTAFDPGAIMRFAGFIRTFTGISGSIGSTWQISKSAFSKLNISRGFRAPNIAELGSNGVHEGTQHYEIGNSNLKPESSLQVDFAIGSDSKHISTELNLFYNNIDNYIFSDKVGMLGNSNSPNSIPIFKFTQGNAHLYGGEFRIDYHPHPLDWIHFENSFSFVMGTIGNQADSARYLPFIPAPRWNPDIKIELEKVNGLLANVYFKLGIEKNWAQNHIYAAYGTETATNGYTLVNFGAGTDFIIKQKTICSLYISAENLTDVAYQSHLSRLKYIGYNNSTQRPGIYNMGRNISFKLLIPIDLK